VATRGATDAHEALFVIKMTNFRRTQLVHPGTSDTRTSWF